MGSSERRARVRQELRGKILDAARELFTAFGYEAVTMRRIAAKIEYSPTTIYLHFSDKDALIRELCTIDFLALASRFSVLEAERDPIERLKKTGRALVDFALERPNHYRMMFLTPHPPVPANERGIVEGNVEEDAWAFLKASVSEARAAGLLCIDAGDDETVAQLFFAGVHGVIALHLAKANDPWIDWRPPREAAERMVEGLIRAFGTAEARAHGRGADPRPTDCAGRASRRSSRRRS